MYPFLIWLVRKVKIKNHKTYFLRPTFICMQVDPVSIPTVMEFQPLASGASNGWIDTSLLTSRGYPPLGGS